MKLLLTSMGVTNEPIRAALLDLLGKPSTEANLLFVPTASFGEGGDKWWFVEDMQRIYKLGWKNFDILAFESLPKEMLVQRLAAADALYVEGGNNYYLAEVIRSHGLVEPLDTFIRNKLWIGASAGSMLFCKHTGSERQPEPDEDVYMKDRAAPVFAYFNWHVMPHFNSKEFGIKRDAAWAEDEVKRAGYPIYFIDDECAIAVHGEDVKVIGSGTWKLLDTT